MADLSDVKEGFLCPICMKDLGTQLSLQSHFIEAHSVEEDPSKGPNIKGIFDKAKLKILGKTEESGDHVAEHVQLNTAAKHLDFSYWEPQDIGFSRDRTIEFRNLRTQTNDDVMVQVNTILIRLEKILKSSTDGKDFQSSSISTRKAIERSLVPWMLDSEAKNCFRCKKSFTVARRKHHCRLCGQVICGNCCEFLPFSFVGKVCALDGIEDLNIDLTDPVEANEQNSLRICCTCGELLTRHYEFLKDKKKKVPIVQIYEKLTGLMSEADLLLPDYNKMAESLSFGDTRYLYQEVQNVRIKLLKLYEALELLSKKVLSLGRTTVKDGETQPVKIGIQSEKLQRGVHAFVTSYLQNNMFTLKSLPSEQEYEKLQAERAALVRRRAEREKAQQEKAMKERALMHKEVLRKERNSRENSPAPRRRNIVRNEGERNVESEAILQQINNVKTFLSKARQKRDYGEISALELNLNELQIEYNKMTKI